MQRRAHARVPTWAPATFAQRMCAPAPTACTLHCCTTTQVAWLGFYKSCPSCRLNTGQLVELANRFAYMMGA